MFLSILLTSSVVLVDLAVLSMYRGGDVLGSIIHWLCCGRLYGRSWFAKVYSPPPGKKMKNQSWDGIWVLTHSGQRAGIHGAGHEKVGYEGSE